MSLTQFKGRGRAYKCVRCGKVDRKGRMVSHVLKHHVPFDRVPYSCSFCSFRCTDKKSLLDHIKKYSRHRDEETRFGQPDYSKILKMAENPYVIGVDDMVQLSKELSVQWHGRHLTQSENPFDDSEGLFEEEEDDVIMSGGLPLPKWLVASTPSKASATETSSYDAGNRTSQHATPQLFFANKAPYATQLAVQQQLQQQQLQQQQLNIASHANNYNVPKNHTTYLPYSKLNLNTNNNNKLFLPTLNDIPTPAKLGRARKN
ncbi:uncharacterized protein LOC132713111 [Ruditapes philippinarum]|uniref:uncharacterized protein LOC132713111 n=1 Tax=Ruditapes philippinarum TaxID=129788 RepID=UPI00295B6F35|nr:uncharacterized protein LOC132713111 [Ruditapes philippinarum]